MQLIFFACLLACLATVKSQVKINLQTSYDSAEPLDPNMKYLLFDVNPVEGFNLRRDVFIRMANLVRKLNEVEAWTLVLPPFMKMRHWKSKVDWQKRVGWSAFFDMSNISLVVPVMELDEYVDRVRLNNFDHVYYLQSDYSVFNGASATTVAPNRYEIRDCESEHAVDEYGFRPQLTSNELPGDYRRMGFENIEGNFWNHPRLFAHRFDCLAVFASAASLVPFLTQSGDKTVLIDRAERLIHGALGEFSPEYWTMRRSMVFNRTLIDAALRYSKRHLAPQGETLDDFYTALYAHYRKYWWNGRGGNESGVLDDKGRSRGGPYVALHYRKADGYGRAHVGHVPSVNEAARQVRAAVDALRSRGTPVHFVYVASDASLDEVQLFKRELHAANVRVATLLSDAAHPDRVLASYADGGIAAIEQLIAAHAAHFIGTAYSTFTYRIQEERLIAGFGPESTFNVLCCDRSCPLDQDDDLVNKDGMRCARVSQWKVLEEDGMAAQLAGTVALRYAQKRPAKRTVFGMDDDHAPDHELEEAQRHQQLLKHTEL